MRPPGYRVALLALYQVSVAIGIALLPFAVLARRGGMRLPIHRLIERLDRAVERAR